MDPQPASTPFENSSTWAQGNPWIREVRGFTAWWLTYCTPLKNDGVRQWEG